MNIIQHFDQTINKNITFSLLTSLIENVSSNIQETLFFEAIKKLDDSFFDGNSWKQNYTCNGFVKRTIITPFCIITFKRRYYMNKNKSLHDNFYYVDQQLEIPTRKHLTNEALALIFNMAADVNSSYASKHAIPTVTISKQTVSNYQKRMNILQDNVPVYEDDTVSSTNEFDVVYIEADEAHCNLQHEVSIDDSRDELKTHKRDHRKVQSKNIINKLVLVHNGHKYPTLHLKRKELNNKHYFGGIHMPTTDLSDNTLDYMYKHYDLSKVKYVFVSGDGAAWIKSLSKTLYESLRSYDLSVIPVLDKFHTNKYLNSIFNFNSEVIKYVKDNFENMTAKRFRKIADAFFTFQLKRNISEVSFLEKVSYICNNVQEIKNQKHPAYKCPCAMEGQISQVLARRLTSRPMGFCEPVLQNLTQMIIYKANGNVITPDIVKEWNKSYSTYTKPKNIRFTKSYKCDYNWNVALPIMNSTNTNIKSFFRKISNQKFY